MGLVVLVIVSLSAIGCGDKEKQMILQLEGQNNQLTKKNQDLESQLSLSKGNEALLMAQIDRQKMDLTSKDSEITQLKMKLASPPKGTGTSTAAGWKTTTFGDQVTVGSDVLFSSGRATLTRAGKRALDAIAATITGRYAGLPVRVYGYTDSDPIKRTRKLWKDNLDLSANRAMAVTRYLISKGVDSGRIETIGMGATHFVTDNRAKASKAKNRRVEIFVVRKQ